MVGKSGKSSPKERTVFLGGIPLDTTYQELMGYLSQFDEIEDIDIAIDKNSKECKGFAKAVLKTDQGIHRLLSISHHVIRGLEIGVKQWTKKADYLKEKDEVTKRKLFVRFHPSYNKDDLALHLSMFGHIESLEVKTHPLTNEKRNFAYVIFRTKEEARKAVLYGSITEKHQFISCEFTTPSFLMKNDTRSTHCKTPTLKNLSIKNWQKRQESNLSLDPMLTFQADKRRCTKRNKKIAICSLNALGNAPNNLHHQGLMGNFHGLDEIRERPRKKKGIHTFNEFNISYNQLGHFTKPTSKYYDSQKVDLNHDQYNITYN